MKENISFIILMGVTGSGKTTLGKMLAERLGWEFHEGDDYHSPGNIRKMSAGIPLTDADRTGWLEALAAVIRKSLEMDQPGVLACSALKQRYRDKLNIDPQKVRFVYLKGAPQQIHERVQNRAGHYMKVNMVASQFDALEEPVDALTIDIEHSPRDCLNIIINTLRLEERGQ